MKIGELHATFVFEDPARAKALWERAERECRQLGIFRWRRSDGPVNLITVMTEDTPEQRQSFENARIILRRGGREIETPADSLEALRARRRNLARAGAPRLRIRTPQGTVVDSHGRTLGFDERPQG